jgi:hypothetical protein
MKISKSRLEEIITEELEDVLRKAQTQYRTGPLGIPIPAMDGGRATTLDLTDDALERAKADFRDEERMAKTAAMYAIERIIKEKDLAPWDTISPNKIMSYLDNVKRKYRKEYEEYHQGYLETLTSHHTDDEEETLPLGTKLSRLFRK